MSHGIRREGARAVFTWVTLLTLGGSSACGGRSQAGAAITDEREDVRLGPGFLSECEQSCAEGLACLDGTCTTTCSKSVDCSSLSSRAFCTQRLSDRGQGQCAVSCSGDGACTALGVGSYCDDGFCVAVSLEQMPSTFDRLDLSRRIEGVRVADGSECDPTILADSFELLRRSRRLSVSSCEPSGSGRFALERTWRVLDDAQLERVEKAVRALRLVGQTECRDGENAFDLQLQPSSGPLLTFADDDHAACPASGKERSSPIDGLEHLYALLDELRLSG